MKTARFVLAALAAIAVSACASTGPYSGQYAQRHTAFEPKMEKDREYMARVEAANAKLGNRVIWVNPPMRPVEEEEAGSD